MAPPLTIEQNRSYRSFETYRQPDWKTSLLAILALTVLLRVILLLFVLHSSEIQGLFKPDASGYAAGIRLASERNTTIGIFTPDTGSYVVPIRGLMHGSFSTLDGPELERTPGYPLFLMITGMVGNHPLLSVACQILSSCLTACLVYKIGILLFRDEDIAILCAGLYAVEPTSIIYSIQLRADTLFTSILLIFVYYLIRYLLAPSWSSLIWAALALSAAVYVKPVAYYLPLCCVIGLAILPSSMTLTPKLLRAVTFIAICAVLIAAWQVRNSFETGYSGFTSLSDRQLYFFNAGGVLAQKEHVDLLTELDKLGGLDPHVYYAVHPEQVNWPISRQLAFQRNEALRTIRENPFLYAKLHIKGMLSLVLHPAASDFLAAIGMSSSQSILGFNKRIVQQGLLPTAWWAIRNSPGIFIATAALEGILLIYYGLALFGVPRLSVYRATCITLALLSLYFVVVAGGPAGGARYRCPIMPMVALFAGAGMGALIRSHRHTPMQLRGTNS